jgi:hypothetical protein
MIIYYVIATVRENACNKDSSISQLVLNQQYSNFTVHNIEQLKILADQGRLFTQATRNFPEARVRIFWSMYFKRWVATTRADLVQCNNLLELLIYYPTSSDTHSVKFGLCDY